ncbi:DUF333 domain-containing protein [Vibrio europaeus]|uniref:DUF333 domain-containing protein n=1 Tax=Vibrio europaeus TaxID=300876 RepID=UPI0023411378|nr:DUF333 domain-containing protein [Vibrio europaeus]MDC5839427.1 DUF333 domain-containing protein [Vibrio europaeus]
MNSRLLITMAIYLASTPAMASNHTTMPKGANPAAQFCVNKGGEMTVIDNETMCVLPNRNAIKADALLRGEKPTKKK